MLQSLRGSRQVENFGAKSLLAITCGFLLPGEIFYFKGSKNDLSPCR